MTGCRISKIKLNKEQAKSWAGQFGKVEQSLVWAALLQGAYGINGFEIENPYIDYIPVELIKE